jgi:hypothetical protein
MQIYVDTAFTVPQYLVLRTLPVLLVGWLLAFGSLMSQGKIVHGGSFNGNEEEGKKEETLTNRLRGRYLARAKIY